MKARRREDAENGRSRQAAFCRNQKKHSVNRTSNQRRTEMGKRRKKTKTGKRENGQKCSRFLVFWFSRSGGRIRLARSRFLCAQAPTAGPKKDEPNKPR